MWHREGGGGMKGKMHKYGGGQAQETVDTLSHIKSNYRALLTGKTQVQNGTKD